MADNTRPRLKHDPKIITNRHHEEREKRHLDQQVYYPESISFPLLLREFVRRTRKCPSAKD